MTSDRRYRLISLVRLSLLLPLGLAGCETVEPPSVVVLPDQRMVPATRLPDDSADTMPHIVEVKVPVAGPQLRPVAVPARAVTATGAAAINSANAGATTQPSADGFLNAIQYYDYAPGLVYTGYVTTISLATGEKLLTAAAGDTTRWIVQSVDSGSGTSAQTLLLVKPRRAGLQTNLVITTDQRVYSLDLSSTDSSTYHTMIAWNYPFGDAVMIRNQVAQQQVQAQTIVATGIDLTKANFNYLILKQRHAKTPPWCPVRAFDDGRKTYIQFPPKVSVTEAPPLFVMGTHGDAKLVNYRVKGDWYIVDRLFDRAELRIGESPQSIIGIQRSDVNN
jgi:P-type conjugative transfer protein TrbG